MSFEKAVIKDLLARSLQLTERVLANEPDGEPDANVRQLHDDLIAWHGRYGGPPVEGGFDEV